MAMHAIDRAPRHGRRPGPQTSRHRQKDPQGARRRPGGALARPVALCGHRHGGRADGGGRAAGLAWLKTALASGLRFDAQMLAEADVMQQRLALVSLPALLMVLGIGLSHAGGGAARRCAERRLELQPQGAAAQVREGRPLRRAGPHVLRPAIGQHAEELPAGADPGHDWRCLSEAQPAALCRGHGPAAAGGDVACRQRGARRLAAAGAGLGAVCRGRRAAAAPPAGADAEDERAGNEAGAARGRGQRRNQVAAALAHARAGQPAHAGRRARRRPGGDEPDATSRWR